MAKEENASHVQVKQRNRIIRKLEKLPDNQLEKIETLTNALLPTESGKKEILRFAGAWGDMEEEGFASFLEENKRRRGQSRRDRFDL